MIENYFTKRQMITLAKGVYRGYDLTSIMLQRIPEFMNPLYSKRVSSRARQALVEIAVQETIIQEDDSNLNCHQASTKSGNYPFLEIVNGPTLTTIAQVRGKMCLPPYAKYRQERSASNQISFFEEDNQPPDCLYFLLTHGYRTELPLFVGLGIPTYDMTGFIDYRSLVAPVPFQTEGKEKEEEFMLQLTKKAEEKIKHVEEKTDN